MCQVFLFSEYSDIIARHHLASPQIALYHVIANINSNKNYFFDHSLLTVIFVTAIIILQTVINVTARVAERGDEMAKVMTDLKISQNKVQLIMARKFMNPYDLCSEAGISYPSYRRIMRQGGCKLSTLGKLAAALECDVTEIIE